MNADIVCIGSPSYWGDVTAQLKTFIDRCTPLCDTNSGGSILPGGKVGISVAVRAGRNAAESISLIETIEHFYSHLGIKVAAEIHIEGIHNIDDLLQREDALMMAYKTGREILDFGFSRRATYSLAVAAARDAAALAELNMALIKEEGGQNKLVVAELEKRMQRLLAGEYCGVLVWVQGKIAGYFLYKPEVYRDGKSGFYLVQHYIKPEYRHKSLDTIALRRIIDICFRDAESVSMDVYHSNPIGEAFWARSACKTKYIRFTKSIPLFSSDDPTKIIGWEQKQTEMTGWRAFMRRFKGIEWLSKK